MDENEYLQTLGEQIVNNRARSSVLAEIRGHIEEQAQDYMDAGMEKEAAERKAVKQMGDPVSTGQSLNEIHRPHFPVLLFGIATALTLFGILMQYLLYTSEPSDNAFAQIPFLTHTVCYGAIGLGIILFFIFGNYMRLAKCTIPLYVLFLAVPFVLFRLYPGYKRVQTASYYLWFLYPLVYALLLYHFREKGAKAIVLLHLFSFVFFEVMLHQGYSVLLAAVVPCGCISFLLLGLSIQKGILRGSKKVLWSLTLIPTAAAAVFLAYPYLRASSYVYDRLMAGLGLLQNSTPGDYTGYTALLLRKDQMQYSLFGGGAVSTQLPREDLYSTYILHSIFLWFGIAVGIAVIAALAFLALYGLRCALRQSNRLALLLGTASSAILLLELLNFVPANLGIGPFYTVSVPFLSYGLANSIANAIVVGILLGIIRNRDVILEYEPEELVAQKV